ncbi:c-type cytochrome [Azospirillum rugosum]|uniref:Mono/diheme cytochrome c family protein n=1 Tax=Azospirillum rugosum TaxID=416170 RepID=A0ABS4SFW3_9PROT|nr:cytochrome c [Azospirillum rugosum]MBP2291450.1 mono/diheme cytochrome c family protein [Azospirillum rugosum]MDQ0525238.1 mono/diheme cytochrome c family protein [Azospirillum rugosum]
MVKSLCRSSVVGLVLVMVAVPAARAASDGPGSPGYGRQLTEDICGECHRVSKTPTAKPPPMQEDLAAPDLTERMRDPGITELALRSYLQTSHPVMPNIRLNAEETDDIVAYLMTLKGGSR